MVVTLSSIPNSATRGLDIDLSSDEGSEEVLEDSKDEPIMKTRVSNFDVDDDGGEQETEAMGLYLLSLEILLFPFFLSFPNSTL